MEEIYFSAINIFTREPQIEVQLPRDLTYPNGSIIKVVTLVCTHDFMFFPSPRFLSARCSLTKARFFH